MSQSTQAHREAAPSSVRCVVITVSDTRTLVDDRGGEKIVHMLSEAGHEIATRQIVPDEPHRIRQLVQQWADPSRVDAILLTGGTGITRRDQTFETISELLSRHMPGYGELFRMLSYEQIGPAAMLSRALGGVVNEVILLTMPGSTAAVQLAMEKLIVPELGHLVHEARK